MLRNIPIYVQKQQIKKKTSTSPQEEQEMHIPSYRVRFVARCALLAEPRRGWVDCGWGTGASAFPAYRTRELCDCLNYMALWWQTKGARARIMGRIGWCRAVVQRDNATCTRCLCMRNQQWVGSRVHILCVSWMQVLFMFVPGFRLCK